MVVVLVVVLVDTTVLSVLTPLGDEACGLSVKVTNMGVMSEWHRVTSASWTI